MTDSAQLSHTAAKVFQQVVDLLQGDTRPGQLQMASGVQSALDDGEKLLVQAGTGTGKSLGYLVPALLYAIENDTVVVVSTATLTLQHQIITKDAPLAVNAIEKVLGVAPRVEVLKGWSNYVCLHKLNGGYAGANDDLFATIEDTKRQEFMAGLAGGGRGKGSYVAQTKRLYKWAHETTTGDQDDAPRNIDSRTWKQVSISSRECIGEKCSFRNECFQVRARDKAQSARVVVTNHAMLGIAAAGHQNPLPEFDALIIDEAHDLVDRVRSQASAELSAAMVSAAGNIAQRLSLQGAEDLILQGLELQQALQALPDRRYETLPSALVGIRELTMTALRAALRSVGEKSPGSGTKQADQVALAKGSLSDLLDTLEALKPDSIESGYTVAWVSRGREGDSEPRLYTAPLDVSTSLAHSLWEERAVVATSATLKLGGSFSHIARDIGFNLCSTPAQCLDVGTPFDPAKQGIIYVASDLPAPGRGEYPVEFWDRLVELVQASDGGTLGLFSSRAKAEAAAQVLRERTDLPILLQGEGTIGGLVQEMREDPRACLLGTLSLWQGVDLPGQTCRLVVIDRIPFPVPTDPLIEARGAAVRRLGGNDFMQVSVTHAALLMAQGSGRLLRTAADRGVVAVLDSRLATKPYGKFLRDSMLPMWPTTNTAVVLNSLRNLSAQLEADSSTADAASPDAASPDAASPDAGAHHTTPKDAGEETAKDPA